MKLVWSPENASKAYIETVKSCKLFEGSSTAELISAMAAGWNAKLIVETWSQGGVTATSIGLAIACRHTGGRHVCVVHDERSSAEFSQAMGEAGMSAEIIVGRPEEIMHRLKGVDFMVVDSQRKDFAKVLKLAKLSSRGAVLVCKNANLRGSSFGWRGALEEASRRIVKSVFLPVGKGLDIAHISAGGGKSGAHQNNKRWIKHIDAQSGEENVIRK